MQFSSQNIKKNIFLGIILLLLILPLTINAQSSDSNTVVTDQPAGTLESAGHRAGDFLWSLVGALVGFLLFFIGAPFLLFKSEFQNKAKLFSKAKPADSATAANGYVSLFGKPQLIGTNKCSILDTPSLYYSYNKEKLTVTQKVVCGSDAERENVVKISPAPDRCTTEIVTRDGRDYKETRCEKCWNANVSEWVSVERKDGLGTFKIGANTVTPNTQTEYMGDILEKKSTSNKAGVDYRETVSYIEASTPQILAVGEAKAGSMASGKPFVVSTKDFEATRQLIVQAEKTMSLILKVLGFLAFLIGMYLILAPIPALINVAGAIPFIGQLFSGLASITGIMIFIVSLVVAIIMTLILTIIFKILRAITDNIVAVIAITIVVGLALMYVLGMVGPKPA
ncbi:hypothetical protein HY990_06390 [Candidatus Micrarchaeota archaeon]|nr:hypothetical protein [Candidatus Micrarchaeota archaeon]